MQQEFAHLPLPLRVLLLQVLLVRVLLALLGPRLHHRLGFGCLALGLPKEEEQTGENKKTFDIPLLAVRILPPCWTFDIPT